MIDKARGDLGVSLNYVICTNFPHAVGAEDPDTNYTSKESEIITRAPILAARGVGDEEI